MMWKIHSHRIAFGYTYTSTDNRWYGWKIGGPILGHSSYKYWGDSPYILLQLDDESATDLGVTELAVSITAIREE